MGRGRKKRIRVRGQKKTHHAYIVAAPAPFGCGTIRYQEVLAD
jgi:hypothetical protein